MTAETLQPPVSETEDRGVEVHKAFLHNNYEIKKRVFRYGTFDLLDGKGDSLLRAEKKLFKFTRKFRLYEYENKSKGKELLSLETRGRPPETYDITDTADPENPIKVGSIRHNIGKSARSFFRTNWDILSPEGDMIGTLKRKKFLLYEIVTPDGNPVASLKQKFSLVGTKFRMNIQDNDPPIDRRLLVAANVVMAERAFEKQRAEPVAVPAA